jgi:CheY-like chemotaxis protein
MTTEKILVIDDSPTIRKIVARNLIRAGYVVHSAEDGEVGLAVAEHERPDLILLDFVMPRMNGFHFCRALRKRDDLSLIPVVLMSAKGDKIGERFIEQMGAVDSLTKPFRPETLLAVTDHVLNKFSDGQGESFQQGSQEVALFFGGSDSLDQAVADKSFEIFFDLVDEPGPDEPTSRDMRPVSSLEDLVADGDTPWAPDGGKAQEVAEQMAERCSNLFAQAMPHLAEQAGDLKSSLVACLTPEALESFADIISRLEPAAGAAAIAGDLALVPLPEVFQLLELQAQTGCLEIRRDDFRVLAFLRQGRLDLAQAHNARNEFLFGRYVREAELLGPDELESLLRSCQDEDGLLGQQLVRRGCLSAEDLVQLLARQTHELMYEVLRWRRGRYAFRPGSLSPEAEMASLGLSTGGIVLEGYRRVDEWRLIQRKIGDFDVVLHRDTDSAVHFSEDRLTSEESAVLAAVDGSRSLRQIVDETQMSSFLVSKLLYRLLSLNLIHHSH